MDLEIEAKNWMKERQLSDITAAEYQARACQTAIFPKHRATEYLTLGLTGESGEIANKVKKLVRQMDGQLLYSCSYNYTSSRLLTPARHGSRRHRYGPMGVGRFHVARQINHRAERNLCCYLGYWYLGIPISYFNRLRFVSLILAAIFISS